MIDSPTPNVSLTFEQLQQISEAEKRLANFNNEIDIAAKNLRVQHLEVQKATKERVYQEELLEELASKVEAKKKELEQLESDVKTTTELVAQNTDKASSVGEANDTKFLELQAREEVLRKQEKKLTQDLKDFDSKSSQLLEDQLSIEKSKDAFLKAIESVQWK